MKKLFELKREEACCLEHAASISDPTKYDELAAILKQQDFTIT